MREIFLEGKDLLKVYGPTTAVNHLDINVYQGEVLALVGEMVPEEHADKILSGSHYLRHKEALKILGEEINLNKYTPATARSKGIRVVHQELSLCKNLTVYENFYIEQYQRFQKGNPKWRDEAREMARQALDRVFPDHGIDVGAGLATLSIAQQQMVEIARATSDPDVKMMVLDEPTSSLPARQTEQLQDYIKKSAREQKIAYIYISHRLKEIMFLADYIYIMQNGAQKYQCPIGETDEDDIVERMGDGAVEKKAGIFLAPELNKNTRVSFHDYSSKHLKNVTKEMYGGEIVAITGLEGNGQLELIQEIFYQAKKKRPGLQISGKVAYVAGDRKKEGIFPLGSIKDNMIVSKIADSALFKPISMGNVDQAVTHWNQRLKTKCASTDDLITMLSGGNQQKVLIGRALAVDADIILLDDPTRGVDIGTKLELYEVFREAAKAGKLVIWKTSDDAELEYCTRLLVMNNGTIAGEFSHEEFDHSSMLKVAFRNNKEKADNLEKRKAKTPRLYLFSLISMLVLYMVCGFMSPSIFSKFGVELLAVGFAPFVFAALAQTFIIGLEHIDLGVGAFMGLVNVICARILDQSTGLGLLCLAGLIIAYSCMGLVIYLRDVPPIIVTLGMSFVWTGIAYVLQDVPGGHVPEWMVHIFNFNNPILQGVLVWLVLFIVAAIFIYRSRYGTALRGFGNNENAMRNSGWSKAKAYWTTYMIAGTFAAMGGIAQSVITGASDVNASATYTMLTVAAVIIGGGYFSGGVVTHIGAVFGGISLTMISVLLGLLKVSTDYTATIQGLVLIIILSLRLIRKEKLQ
ncbi:MAG: ABC transporter permease subunit [[Clostridium] scindens]